MSYDQQWPIQDRNILMYFLLFLLNEYKSGLYIGTVYRQAEKTADFPSDWHRPIPRGDSYSDLKKYGFDYKTISPELLTKLVPTEAQWKNELRWARYQIKKKGLLDLSAPRGTWRLNENGLRTVQRIKNYLKDHID
jgi:hypothetical protein